MLITLLLLLFLGWFAIATTTGSRFVFSQIEHFLDDQLVIDEVSGTIIGPLNLQGIEFNSDSVNLKLALMELDWSPCALISLRTLQIEKLRLQGLQLVLPEHETSSDTASPGGLPDDLRLPLSIRINELELIDATITRGTDNELISFQRVLATDTSWQTRGIEIMQLTVKSSLTDFTAHAQILPEAEWPLSVDARYALGQQAGQLSGTTGTIALSGSLVQLGIVQTLDAPYGLRVEANVSHLLEKPEWQANASAANMQLTRVDKHLPALGLTASLSAGGDTTQAQLKADLQVQNSTVQIEGSVSFEDKLSGSPAVDLQLTWQKLVWPLDAADQYMVASDTGKAHVTGVLDNYRATIVAELAVPAYPAGHIDLDGAGSRRGFNLEQIVVSTLGGQVRGSGSVNWENGISTRFDLSGKNIDPAGLNAKWSGSLNFTSTGEALITDATVTSVEGNMALDGLLRGKPVEIAMKGHYDETGLSFPSLVINALGATLNAEGTISTQPSRPMNFKWRLSMNDLGFLTRELAGTVQSEGTLTGTPKAPRIKASLTATGLAIAEMSIDHARMTTDLGLGASPLSLNASLEGLRLGETQVGEVELDLSGTLARHVLGLSTVSETGTNHLALSGSLSDLPSEGAAAPMAHWSNTTWQFSFDALEFNEGDIAIDLIKDSQPGYRGRVDGDSITISDTCFSVTDTREESRVPPVTKQRICAQATGSYDDELSGSMTFNNLPLMMLNPLLPPSTGLTGTLGGIISLGWNLQTNTPSATAALNTSRAGLQSKNSQGDITTLLHFEPGQLNANWSHDALSATVDLPLAGSSGVRATANIAPGQGGEFSSRAITANVTASFDELDWMADFLQGVTQLSGKLDSHLQIGGTIAGPVLVGNLTLNNGKAVLPGPGLTLRELNLGLVGAGDAGVTLTGSVRSGGGTLSLDGNLNDIGSAMTGRISLTGQRVLILNTPEAEIYVSPTINASLKQTHLQLTGEVSMDSANIQLASLPQTAASVSDDQIIAGTDTLEDETGDRFDITTRLHLLLNDAVSFSGFGLEATFGGDLNLVDLPGKPTTANGDINVLEGEYRAYGQQLTIETGKLLFVGGPINQPGIDVRAVRQITPDIKVGALARGNLRAPEFVIFSEPPMNQSDQLAYLVLGRPLSTSSSDESSVLSRAALAMGIKGGNYLTEQFGSKLGVDRIGIETPGTNANEQAALVVGKYLSPRLFVSYGIGVLDAVSTLKIEYLLSSRWRLSSESSVDQGGLDLTYVLEP